MLKLLYFSRRLFGLAVNLFVQLWQFFFPQLTPCYSLGTKRMMSARTHSRTLTRMTKIKTVQHTGLTALVNTDKVQTDSHCCSKAVHTLGPAEISPQTLVYDGSSAQ